MKVITNTAAPKAQAKKTSTAAPQQETIHAAHDDILNRFNEAREDLLTFFGAPGWKRTLIAMVSTFLTSFGVATMGLTMLDWLLVGAVAAGVSTFIQMVIIVLGVIAAVYFAFKAGVRVGGAVITGEADARAVQAYDAMKSLARRFNPFAYEYKKAQPVAAKAA